MGLSFSAMGATLIDAVAQGECTNLGACTSATSLSRSFAGLSQNVAYRDWFTFSVLPTVTVSSATLSIYNLKNNVVNSSPNEVFNLYAPTDFSFSGLIGNSTSLGSVTAINADQLDNLGQRNSQYVDIALNAEGLAYINSNLGKSITFGGSSSGGDAQFFGYVFTAGKPAVLSVSPVPEPETYAMLLAGLWVMGSAVKRRKSKQG
jgi:hypothetical protein